jgi:hypothetical protein
MTTATAGHGHQDELILGMLNARLIALCGPEWARPGDQCSRPLRRVVSSTRLSASGPLALLAERVFA